MTQRNVTKREGNSKKKYYLKPMLIKFGSIEKLTKGTSGSAMDSTPADSLPTP